MVVRRRPASPIVDSASLHARRGGDHGLRPRPGRRSPPPRRPVRPLGRSSTMQPRWWSTRSSSTATYRRHCRSILRTGNGSTGSWTTISGRPPTGAIRARSTRAKAPTAWSPRPPGTSALLHVLSASLYSLRMPLKVRDHSSRDRLVGPECGVALQNESFLDGLAHAVEVEGSERPIRPAHPKQLQGLGLWGSGEGNGRNVGRLTPPRHLRQGDVVQLFLRCGT